MCLSECPHPLIIITEVVTLHFISQQAYDLNIFTLLLKAFYIMCS